MFAFLIAAAALDPVATLDILAQKRDAAAIARMAADPLSKPETFRFLQVGGAFGSGADGWRVRSLADADGKTRWAVFTTKTTNEDIADQVFELKSGKLIRRLPESDGLGYQIRHHDFDVSFEIGARRAIVVDRMLLRRSGQWRPSLQLRIGPHFRVKRVRASDGRAVRFAQAGGVVSVASPRPAEFRLLVDYEGKVDTPHFAGAVNEKEAMLTGDFWYPMIARGAATYTARVTAPRAWTTIAQGVKTGEKLAGTSKTTTWSMGLPTCVFSLTSGPYRKASLRQGGRTYSAYSTTLPERDLLIHCELSQPIIEFFSGIAPYPFPEWAAVDSPNYGSGWLEAYSFATYEQGSLPVEDAHEPSHTWWGGIVPNTYLRSFWNESFASYSEGLYAREGPIGDRAEKRAAFVDDAEPSPAYGELPTALAGCEAGPVATALGYGKGAVVLQMLEVEIGTPAMLASLREWCRSHPKGDVGEWEGFERAAARATGRDLKPFFDDWLRKPGWMDLSVTDLKWTAGRIEAHIEFGRHGVHFRPEALLEFADGRREFVRMEVTGDRAYVACPEKPALVSIDPWLRMIRPVHESERPVELRRHLRGKVWVARGREEEADRLLGAGWRGRSLAEPPQDLAGTVLVGHPGDLPEIGRLLESAGLDAGPQGILWRGKAVAGAVGAMAVAEVPGGHVVVAFGRPEIPPRYGRARAVAFDRLGRFLRGLAEPKTSGPLTFRP